MSPKEVIAVMQKLDEMYPDSQIVGDIVGKPDKVSAAIKFEIKRIEGQIYVRLLGVNQEIYDADMARAKANNIPVKVMLDIESGFFDPFKVN